MRLLNSFLVWSFFLHVTISFASMLLGDDVLQTPKAIDRKLFIFFVLFLLPRIIGLLLGSWGVFGWPTKPCQLPLGKWNYLGNMGPEIGVEFTQPYSGEGGTRMGECYFLQSPTIGGLLMVPFHVLSQLLWPMKIRTSTKFVHGYYIPEIENPADGWQKDVLIIPTLDPKVWYRSFRSAPDFVPYVWMHESHEHSPLDDYIFISEKKIGIFISVFCCALVFMLIIWSKGLLLAVFVLEAIIKRGQYHITTMFVSVIPPLQH